MAAVLASISPWSVAWSVESPAARASASLEMAVWADVMRALCSLYFVSTSVCTDAIEPFSVLTSVLILWLTSAKPCSAVFRSLKTSTALAATVFARSSSARSIFGSVIVKNGVIALIVGTAVSSFSLSGCT